MKQEQSESMDNPFQLFHLNPSDLCSSTSEEIERSSAIESRIMSKLKLVTPDNYKEIALQIRDILHSPEEKHTGAWDTASRSAICQYLSDILLGEIMTGKQYTEFFEYMSYGKLNKSTVKG